jgi:hypothetical protein
MYVAWVITMLLVVIAVELGLIFNRLPQKK